MPRKKIKKHQIEPDFIYNNIKVSTLINHIMKMGKKTIAQKIVYESLLEIGQKTKKDPIEVFEKALENASPLLELKSKRVGGATYQVPTEVKEGRKETLAIRWILKAARSRKGKPMKSKLAEELIEAADNKGSAIKKKEEIHRMAEANRAFAHFRF
ncbi:MAG: 30S ribosomal protein S7 [Patescibacteria group bacterium]|nr:30S ribosomal protein S7 [Patescibacteria group bacterium]MBU1876974.1 30S ribosomal protein S7 [Patescibacteria group bacterium]